MMKMKMIALALLIGSAGFALAQSPAPVGDAANGQKLFLADGCYQCHGTVGQGSRGTGPKLAPDPIPYEIFANQVRKPVAVMPPYTALVLSDAQLADVYAYVSSLPGPPKAESVTILH
jgi:ubiquinol-cytochrome c reductase cytochrome c subunit